ncbi:MAG: hypothetical protein RJA81_642 [Planctomycetota bacterium]
MTFRDVLFQSLVRPATPAYPAHYQGITTMIRRQFLGLASLFLISVSVAQAADKDFNGKWLYTWERQGMKIESTFELKQDGDKVTGTVSGMNGQKTEITGASVKDGLLTFKVVRERNGNKFETAYEAKVDGDSLKGKIGMEFNGQKREREFEAKRVD